VARQHIDGGSSVVVDQTNMDTNFAVIT